MPELPEVETVVRTLRPMLVGARVERLESSGLPLRMARAIDRQEIERVSLGGQVMGVRRRGKYIVVELCEPGGTYRGAVVIHLGMTGRLRVQPVETERVPHTHVVWSLTGGREMRFSDPRRFGWVEATVSPDALPELVALGPDPLADLTADGLAAALSTSRAPIKAFLLDQSRIAGLGNIYVCEALFLARVHPGCPARRVGKKAVALTQAIREVLEQAIANRGTTLRDYVDAWGEPGGNGFALTVYGREKQPCVACGGRIRRRVDAARSTFYCPRCQRA